MKPASKGPFHCDGGFIDDANDENIAVFESRTAAETCANAAYFAHAANVHERLVEALKEAYADIGSVLPDKKMHAALAKIKAALDAAKGE